MAEIKINDYVTLADPIVTSLPHLNGIYKVLQKEKGKEKEMLKLKRDDDDVEIKLPLDCVIKANG